MHAHHIWWAWSFRLWSFGTFHFRTKIAEQIVTGNFWNMVIIIF